MMQTPHTDPAAGETIRTEAISIAVPFIKRFEGFSSRPYLCAAGKWTIGWGCTRYPNGELVHEYDPAISQAEAEFCLMAAVARVDRDLKPLVKREPTARQYAALLSLAYNVGVGVQDGIKGDLADSSLLARFNSGMVAGAAQEFIRWNKAHVNGRLVELDGLTRRRQAERDLFLEHV